MSTTGRRVTSSLLLVSAIAIPAVAFGNMSTQRSDESSSERTGETTYVDSEHGNRGHWGERGFERAAVNSGARSDSPSSMDTSRDQGAFGRSSDMGRDSERSSAMSGTYGFSGSATGLSDGSFGADKGSAFRSGKESGVENDETSAFDSSKSGALGSSQSGSSSGSEAGAAGHGGEGGGSAGGGEGGGGGGGK